MPRRPRLHLPGTPLHIVQRGNDRQACFHAASDYRLYLTWLQQAATQAGCDIHAYALMTNHVHLLLTPQDSLGPARLMKQLAQRYGQHLNRTYQRSGSRWEGRYHSCPILSETYVMNCLRYIDLNPVRAGLVSDPADYPWSSCLAHVGGTTNHWLQPHPLYLALGATPSQRQAAYRALCHEPLRQPHLDQIRRATQRGYVLKEREKSWSAPGLGV